MYIPHQRYPPVPAGFVTALPPIKYRAGERPAILSMPIPSAQSLPPLPPPPALYGRQSGHLPPRPPMGGGPMVGRPMPMPMSGNRDARQGGYGGGSGAELNYG